MLAWVGSLIDAGVKADVTTATTTGTLNYNGILTILNGVQSRGPVIASELADLKTIAANLNIGTTTSPYLSYVFNALVNGDPANATWVGGGGTSAPLGNLAVGTSSIQLGHLISKWFLGGDLPAPITESGTIGTYALSNLPLYGPGGVPSDADVHQGQTNDCNLIAILGETAATNPQIIQSMITSNGNGTYGVRFYNLSGQPVYVTVNAQFPVSASGLSIWQSSPTDMWAALVEKAFVQANASGVFGYPLSSNSYQNIDGGSAVVSSSIGWDTSFPDVIGGTQVVFHSSSSNWNSYKQTFINALNNGGEIIIHSEGYTTDSSGKTCFVSAHQLYVIGYDSATGDFIIRNPWGASSNPSAQYYETQFEASMADIASVHADVYVVANGVTSLTPVVVTPTQKAIGLTGSVPLASLFSVSDANKNTITGYWISQITPGVGSVSLNGAVIQNGSGGFYHVSAADMAKITVGGNGTAGMQCFDIIATDATTESDHTSVSVIISSSLSSTPNSATMAINSYNAGQVSVAVPVLDTSAAIVANLDSLQKMAAANLLGSVTMTDSGTPTLSITPTQLAGDAAALSLITGSFSLNETASAANCAVCGLSGHANTVVFSGMASQYSITGSGDGVSFAVNDTGTGRSSIDHLSNVTQVQFADKTITIANSDDANVARLYQAAFGRAPDAAGLKAWVDIYATVAATAKEAGATTALALTPVAGLPNIASGFTNSSEFQAKYGTLNNADYLTQIYTNVLGRIADASGYNAWLSAMNTNGYTKEMVLVGFAESAENVSGTTYSANHATGWLFGI